MRERQYTVDTGVIALLRVHGHTDREFMPTAADDHAAQRRYVAEIASPRNRDVIGADAHIVGGIQIHPSERRAENRHPGVRSVGAHPISGRIGRRMSAQIATDVACRQARESAGSRS